MRHASKILKYEIHNLLRSKWLPLMAVALFVVTEALFRFGGDVSKTITSLMNIVLIVIPLMSLMLGTIFFYNSREFNELLLAQPLRRGSIYAGQLCGFVAAFSLAFLLGTGVPFLIHGFVLGPYAGKILTLLFVGIAFIVIFTSLAFFFATRFEDKIRGFGTALLVWFLLAVVYDGLILLFIHAFQDYPYEPGLLALVALNPIDLGRIAILLRLDISALMGYTGAVFQKTFGTPTGAVVSTGALLLYAVAPALLGLRTFRRKDF